MQSLRISVRPELIRWARERANYSIDDLSKSFGKLPDWESGKTKPTLNQLEAFARKVNVPIGYMYFDIPPDEKIPVSDFRTFAGKPVTRHSPNLLSTLIDCELRQDWYRDFAIEEGLSELNFVGSASIEDSPRKVAQQVVTAFNFDLNARKSCATWTEAFRYFIRQVDETGVLVMVSGIAGSNTHRKLDPEEFRGFALADPVAPLVFVNGADTKAAQIFTLVHELAHLWLGESALSNSGIKIDSESPREEMWCNAVAAEVLVPLEHFKEELKTGENIAILLSRLARLYKVSSLVVLQRMLDAGHLDNNEFQNEWRNELEKSSQMNRHGISGGNYYRSTISRVGRRFAFALISSTNVGKTLSRDAFRLLGIKRAKTFDQLARELRVHR